jgi:hypothetical protein
MTSSKRSKKASVGVWDAGTIPANPGEPLQIQLWAASSDHRHGERLKRERVKVRVEVRLGPGSVPLSGELVKCGESLPTLYAGKIENAGDVHFHFPRGVEGPSHISPFHHHPPVESPSALTSATMLLPAGEGQALPTRYRGASSPCRNIRRF